MAYHLIDLDVEDNDHQQLGLLLAMLDEGTKEWRSELGDVPQETITWQPFEQGHSIGSVLLHIADVEAFWIQEVAGQEKLTKDMLELFMTLDIKQDDVKWPIPPSEPIEWYWEVCDNVRRTTHDLVQKLGDPLMSASSDSQNFYTLRWLLSHVIAHESYHGGQIVLLKLLHMQAG